MPSIKKLLQAAAGNAGETLGYVEDVFSTYLYEGNGSTQTITNGIDLDGEGGLVWSKKRSGSEYHVLFDTEAQKRLETNTTVSGGSGYIPTYFNFLADGYFMDWSAGGMPNDSGDDYASWTFRKAEKFFDVVTYTGNDTSRSISHSLGSVPGCIIIKNVSSGGFDWVVYHRSSGATNFLKLNTTAAVATNATYFPSDPTSTVFNIGAGGLVNNGSDTYVAYLFAHDAGGFGDDGDESIIKCGSFSGSATNIEIDCGFEPQWILIKSATNTSDWYVVDVMRGMSVSDDTVCLSPNLSGAENTDPFSNIRAYPTATGFVLPSGGSYWNTNPIYIAIRRPMKTPESGTEVFDPAQGGASVANNALVTTTNFPVDMFMNFDNYTSGGENFVVDRLRGRSAQLRTQYTAAEAFYSTNNPSLDSNEGLINRSGSTKNKSSAFYWSFKRATGFFDVVAYTGDGVNPRSITHNLNVIPEMIIIKKRSTEGNWWTWVNGLTDNATYAQNLQLSETDPESSNNVFYKSSDQSSTAFKIGAGFNGANDSSATYIAYLFATLAGVSKVGSYTGTGADLNVDCGFSAGARFILIKRTDSTGDWYVWDSARGIVAGNDPYLLLNSLAAEVTSTDYIDPLSSGFTVTSSAPAALNASGGTYIFLAIA